MWYFGLVFISSNYREKAGPMYFIGSGGATWSPLYDMDLSAWQGLTTLNG